jgi:hypothetical protein
MHGHHLKIEYSAPGVLPTSPGIRGVGRTGPKSAKMGAHAVESNGTSFMTPFGPNSASEGAAPSSEIGGSQGAGSSLRSKAVHENPTNHGSSCRPRREARAALSDHRPTRVSSVGMPVDKSPSSAAIKRPSRGHQEAISGHQRPSRGHREAIERPSAAIRDHQRPSEIISGHQRTCRARKPSGPHPIRSVSRARKSPIRKAPAALERFSAVRLT